MTFCIPEAENAFHLKKRIVPLIMEEYKAHGWLGALVRTTLYFRFDTDEMLEKNFPDLVRALGDSGRKPRKGENCILLVNADIFVSFNYD